MTRKTNLILAAVAAIGLLGLAQPAGASVASSNGTGIDPCPGTGEVAVTLSGNCENDTTLGLSKVFFEVVDHEMEWNLEGDQDLSFNEDIANETGIAWLDFHISFELLGGTDFAIEDFGVVADVPFTIEEMTGDLFEFWIFFDEPLLSGQGFVLSGEIATTSQVILLEVRQHPSIPEPGSLALFATGLGVLAFIGWRRRRAA